MRSFLIAKSVIKSLRKLSNTATKSLVVNTEYFSTSNRPKILKLFDTSFQSAGKRGIFAPLLIPGKVVKPNRVQERRGQTQQQQQQKEQNFYYKEGSIKYQ